jgi:hypothetical protein
MSIVLPPRFAWSLYARWILANALGELIGLGLTFTVGISSVMLIGEPHGTLVAIALGLMMAASGAIEGVIVGIAQWWAIQTYLPAVSRKSWVAATVIGALVAWTFGSIPTTMMSIDTDPVATSAFEPEASLMYLMAGLMGALLGIVLALAQWVILRRYVDNAWWWLPANSVAWLLGMPVVFKAVDLAQKAGSPVQALLIFAGALTLTGAVVGAVHGIALVKLASQEVQ